jgi:hypothetical protein
MFQTNVSNCRQKVFFPLKGIHQQRGAMAMACASGTDDPSSNPTKGVNCQYGLGALAAAYRTEDPGFKSRQGVIFLGFIHIALLLSKLNMHYCV